MDVRAVVQNSLQAVKEFTASSSAVQNTSSALSQISARASRLVESVSTSSALSPAERQAMINATATAEQYISNPEALNEVYNDLATMGIYLNESSTTDFPRWAVLTGLRLYSGKSHELVAKEAMTEQQAMGTVKKQLAQMAQNFRQTSLADVQQSVRAQPQAEMKIAKTLGHAVELTNEGVGEAARQPHTVKVV